MPPRRRRQTRESPALVAFGRQLRRMREAKGVKQETIGQLTNLSGPQISRIEAGKRRASRSFVEIVDNHLDAGNALVNLWEDLNKDGHPIPVWFDWPRIEADAVELITWEHTIVAGLLQTEEYARAFLPSDEAVEVRVARQAVLNRDDPPPATLVALLDRRVLDYLVGSPQIMKEQMGHLLTLSELPTITIQLIQSNGRPAGTGGAFVIATMEDRSEVAYMETIVRGITTDAPEDLSMISDMLRELRARAFPEEASRELIREAMERWT
jgi:transcriptional regulator with XRE-family HTH domain